MPYKHELSSIQDNAHHPVINTCIYSKSKQIYDVLVNKKKEELDKMSDFIAMHTIPANEKKMFITKLKKEKEIKLKEYNFKLLHGILPCNSNLRKWRIKRTDQCDTCQMPQTIKHLLFDCVYLQPLWRKIDSALNTRVTFDLILGADTTFKYNEVLTLITFLIYKEWLLLSLENKSRNNNISFNFYKMELQLRLNIYRKTKKYSDDYIKILSLLLNRL